MASVVRGRLRNASPDHRVTAISAGGYVQQQVDTDYSVIYWENFVLDNGATKVSFCVRRFPARGACSGGGSRYELDVRFRQAAATGPARFCGDSAAGPAVLGTVSAGQWRPQLLWDVSDSVVFDWSPPSMLPRTNGHLEVDRERGCVVSHLVPMHPEGWHVLLSWACDGHTPVPSGLKAQIQLQDGRRVQHPANQVFVIPLSGDPSILPELPGLPRQAQPASALAPPARSRSMNTEAFAELQECQSETSELKAKAEVTARALTAVEQHVESLTLQVASRPSRADASNLEARLEEEQTSRRVYQEEIMNLRGRIRTFCRIRPHDHCTSFVDNAAVVRQSRREVLLPSQQRHFEFDLVFGPDSPTASIWEETWPLIDSVFEQPGMSACVMAYGQTGAGKTFSMEGSAQQPGLIHLALDRLFKRIEREEEKRQSELESKIDEARSNLVQISLSMLEVYQEQMKDLLVGHDGGPRLTLRNIGGEGGPEVRELRVEPTKSCEEALALYQSAARLRKLGTSEKNSSSSRSHLVLTLYVQRLDAVTGEVVSTGKVSLVDLAGSERQSSRSALDRERVSEASVINNSLSSLSKVVQACVTRAASPQEKGAACHIPYRDTVLTQLLSDSIGGQGKTLVIVHVTQHDEDVQESLRTLQFATNAACVQERPTPRPEEDKLRRQISRLTAENQRLKDELAGVAPTHATPNAKKRYASPQSPRLVCSSERSESIPRYGQATRDDSPCRHLVIPSARALGSPRATSPRATPRDSIPITSGGACSVPAPGRKYANRCPPAPNSCSKTVAPRGGG